LRVIILPSSAINSGKHSRILQTHGLLTTRRAKKADEGNSDFQEPDKTLNVSEGHQMGSFEH
jgi:ABC-type metal ion transport system substrate-binding protein